MRKTIIIGMLAVSACLLVGCDFFRAVAGRPTSQEIEAKRKLIAMEVEASQPSVDTVRMEQPAGTAAPSDPAEPVAAPVETPAARPVDLRGIRINARPAASFGSSRPAYRYYVMIGTFGSRDNAVRQAGKAQTAGYPATLIPLGSQLTGVGLSGSDDLGAVVASLERLRSEAFCPKDAWILHIE